MLNNNFYSYIFVLILFLVSILLLLCTLYLSSRLNFSSKNEIEMDWLKPGSLAPGFNIIDIDGNILELDSYKDKGLLIVFLSPSCRTCSSLLEKMNIISQDIKKELIETLIVSVAPENISKQYFSSFHLDLKIVFESRHSSRFVSDYKIGATPFYCLLNTKKRVVEVGYFSPKVVKEKWVFKSDGFE